MIQRLEFIHFGKFHKESLDLDPGINYIFGENEAGKSTIFHFIIAMLYGFSKDSKSRKMYNEYYEKYKPLEGSSYKGAMEVSVGDRVYRIERNFLKDRESCKIWDKGTGESFDDAPELFENSRIPQPGLLLFGLDQDSFIQYFALRDLMEFREDKALEDELFLAQSFGQSNNFDLDPQGAMDYLEEKLKDIGSPRAKKSRMGKILIDLDSCREKTKEALFTKMDWEKNLSFLQELDLEKEKLEEELQKFLSRQPELDKDQIQEDYRVLAELEEKKKRALILDNTKLENEKKMDSYDEAHPWLANRQSKSHLFKTILSYGLSLGTLVGLFFSLMADRRPLSLFFSFLLVIALLFVLLTSRIKTRDRTLEREYSQLFHQQDQVLSERFQLAQELEDLLGWHIGEDRLLSKIEEAIQRKEETISKRELMDKNPFYLDLDDRNKEIERKRLKISLQLDEIEKKREEEEIFTKKLRSLEESLEDLEEEKKATELALKIIEEILETDSKDEKKEFYNRASSFFYYASEGKYSDPIREQDEYSFFDRRRGLRIPQKMLSRSSQELLLLSLRMAMMDSKAGPDLPLLMDEGFVHFDERRKSILFTALEHVNRQVIFLSKEKNVNPAYNTIKL